MKENYQKTLLGSIIAFFIGTSCCWLSSLAIWLGGAALLGSIIHFIEDIQLILILVGVVFGIVSIVLYVKRHKKGI